MICVSCQLLIDAIYCGGGCFCAVLVLNVRSVLEIDLYIYLKLEYVSFPIGMCVSSVWPWHLSTSACVL